MPFSIGRSFSAAALTVLLVLTASSCHKKQVAIPLPSEPAPTPAAETTQQPTPPVTTHPATTPAPGEIPLPAQASPPKDESNYQKSKPAEQPAPPKRVSRPPNPALAQPTAAPNPVPPDAPRLGDILTPDQQREYNAAIDLSVAHAQTSLGSITSRHLTKEQEATITQVRNFIKQAQEKKEKDELGAAKSLAERAEVLAHDLAASVR